MSSGGPFTGVGEENDKSHIRGLSRGHFSSFVCVKVCVCAF